MTFECDISNGRWRGTTKVFDVDVLLVRARLEGKRITEKTAPPPFVAIRSGDWSLEDTKHTTHEKTNSLAVAVRREVVVLVWVSFFTTSCRNEGLHHWPRLSDLAVGTSTKLSNLRVLSSRSTIEWLSYGRPETGS